ncbi:hypothetical protein G6011_09935 [Alternaria panax]|uniref:Uncharacterized protein n=1 Tax=Alternaria panax TaxID=48097 RepID=A0AAD4FBQ8_9PLEO|nr:hypothetical protein G6011_09935 [Alternaria panax]
MAGISTRGLEDLQLQRELKQIVLEHVTTIYQPTYPSNHGFSILICRHQFDRSTPITAAAGLPRRSDRAEEFIMIRAVIFIEPGHKKWKLVAESSKAYYSIIPALQEFSKDLEREMGQLTGLMKIGDNKRFSERNEGLVDEDEQRCGHSRKRHR